MCKFNKVYKEITVTMKSIKTTLLSICILSSLSIHSQAKDNDIPDAELHPDDVKVCEGFGPQTPRDIDSVKGTNKRIFSLAPSYQKMNLCNIHFHKNAEHKAKAFSVFAGKGDHGGYQCNMSQTLSKEELSTPKNAICNGLIPGDTIEVHWVHTSCDIQPGKGLGSCLSESCANPDLRVETQVFTLVNDKSALDFKDLSYDNHQVNGLHQAKLIPNNTGQPVEFLGSTTGPSYTEQVCSPLQVTWSVRPQCAKLDINSIGNWCESNVFEEDHAHGIRKLVTNPDLLSEIK
jgi:carbonic anhydrase